jgi:tellurite resistance protein
MPTSYLTEFATDVEIARRWGVSEKTARIAIRELRRDLPTSPSVTRCARSFASSRGQSSAMERQSC